MDLITNVSKRENLLRLLKDIGRRSSKAQIAVAFIFETGAKELLKIIRKSKMEPSAVTIITATCFGMTEPDALRLLLDAGVKIREYTGGGTFHLKLYCFWSTTGREFVLGSANLSAGALTSNVEASVHILEADDLQFARDSVALLEQVKSQSVPWTKQRIRSYEKRRPDVRPQDEALEEVAAEPGHKRNRLEPIQPDEPREETITQYLTRRQIYRRLPPRFTLKDKVVVFTGFFEVGTQRDCREATRERGGLFDFNVTRRTDVLVVGTYGNPQYSWEHYGTKIEKACQYREETGKPLILTEAQWLKKLR